MKVISDLIKNRWMVYVGLGLVMVLIEIFREDSSPFMTGAVLMAFLAIMTKDK